MKKNFLKKILGESPVTKKQLSFLLLRQRENFEFSEEDEELKKIGKKTQ